MLTVVLVTLLDGSTINLKLPSTTTLTFKTTYGELQIPLGAIRECSLGVHVDNPGPYVSAVADLGKPTYGTRDEAMKFLKANPRGAYRYLCERKEGFDAETTRRVELLLKEYKEFPQRDDRLSLNDGTLTGMMQQTKLKGESDCLGAMEIRLSQIQSLSVRMSKTTLTLSPGSWVSVGRIGGPLRITASGQVDLWAQQPGQYMAHPAANFGGYVFGSHPAGALLGRVNGGQLFLVGDNFSARDMATGQLELKINESPWPTATQTGSYEVVVE